VRSSPKPCNVTLTTAAHRTSCDGSPLRSSCSVLKPQPSGRSWRSSPRATDTPQRLAQGLQLPIHLTVAAIVTYLLRRPQRCAAAAPSPSHHKLLGVNALRSSCCMASSSGSSPPVQRGRPRADAPADCEWVKRHYQPTHCAGHLRRVCDCL
jgi:hypothetical protein